MIDDIQQYVPVAGVAAAVTIWLRQYWFQQRLTNEIVQKLRDDNERLRELNEKLTRENTVLRAHADAVDLELLAALEEEPSDE